MPKDRRARVLVVALPLLAAACAAPPQTATPVFAVPVASAKELPPVPVCRDEMRAYVELTRLAKLHGDAWTVFAPAVDAMKQQILDCLSAVFPAAEPL